MLWPMYIWMKQIAEINCDPKNEFLILLQLKIVPKIEHFQKKWKIFEKPEEISKNMGKNHF